MLCQWNKKPGNSSLPCRVTNNTIVVGKNPLHLADLNQHPISELVSIFIVDRLETVDVAHHGDCWAALRDVPSPMRVAAWRNFGRSERFFIIGYDADIILRSER
jgi:hypothetical protein